MTVLADCLAESFLFFYLRRAFRSRVFSLIQFVPALHQFYDNWLAEVHQLETSYIGPTMHESLQRNVFKSLGEKKQEKM